MHTVDTRWHSPLQERGGSGQSRAGGSFGAQALPWGFPVLLPSASAQTIKTIHDTDLLSFLKTKQDAHTGNHSESVQEKTWALFWDRLKENVKMH